MSITLTRRWRRMAWRASFAAIATSQGRTSAGSRSEPMRRHAMAHAVSTTSRVSSTSPQTTNATRAMDAW